MTRLFPFIVIMVSLSLAAPAAMAVTFSAGIENSRWSLSDSIFACSLRHPVPGYGEAVFYHRAGESLSFYLNPERNPMRAGKAALVLERPAWQAGKTVAVLGHVSVADTHERPVELETPDSLRMMHGLRDGRMPTFTRRARYSEDRVSVRLSHVNYDDRYQAFRECQSQLLPVNFDQVQRTVILFGLGETELSDDAKDFLDKVALFANADERVDEIYVDGHTDASGTPLQNREISKQRAQAVTEYLVSKGLSEDMIETRFHGSRYPVEGVERPSPRHRRATVRLERSGETDADQPVITESDRENIVIIE